MLKVLDLFSGIGGFSLGLERTGGFKTVAFCEIEPFCRKVLAKHWPDVRQYEDVRELTAAKLAADGIAVDVICGGFPCQDISFAGTGAGIDGERSGLWSEYARLIGELRPRYVIVENVAALLGRGLDRVLGDLAALGFDAEWHCISASAVGAPHRRDRTWIVAHPRGQQHESGSTPIWGAHSAQFLAPHADSQGEHAGTVDAEVGGAPGPVADASGTRLALGQWALGARAYAATTGSDWWATEPDVGRVVARLSPRMDGDIDAAPTSLGTREIMCALQRYDGAEALQWPARGYGGIQEASVLLSLLREHAGPPKSLGNVSLARSEASQIIVRGVWFDGKTACPSCRRRSIEQRPDEYPNLVRLLPPLLACDCGSTWLDRSGTPSETPRVDRLRALGNAVVPQIPELIGRAILATEVSCGSSLARRTRGAGT